MHHTMTISIRSPTECGAGDDKCIGWRKSATLSSAPIVPMRGTLQWNFWRASCSAIKKAYVWIKYELKYEWNKYLQCSSTISVRYKGVISGSHLSNFSITHVSEARRAAHHITYTTWPPINPHRSPPTKSMELSYFLPLGIRFISPLSLSSFSLPLALFIIQLKKIKSHLETTTLTEGKKPLALGIYAWTLYSLSLSLSNNKANNSFLAKQDKDYELFPYARRNGNV